MSDEAFLYYEAQLPRLQAREEAAGLLREARAGRVTLSAEGWHDLTLLVTGDKDAAERAAHDALLRSYENES